MRMPRNNIITLLTLASYEDSFHLGILFSLKIFLNGQFYLSVTKPLR